MLIQGVGHKQHSTQSSPLSVIHTHTLFKKNIGSSSVMSSTHGWYSAHVFAVCAPISSVPAVIWLSLTVSRGAELGSQEVRFLCRKFIFLSNSRLEPLRHRKELKFSQSSHAWMSDDKWSVISDKLASPSSHFCLFSLPDFSYLLFFCLLFVTFFVSSIALLMSTWNSPGSSNDVLPVCVC